MDIFGAIALASEPPHPTILKGKQMKPDEKIITPEMWRQIFGVALYQIIVLSLLLFTGAWTFDLTFNYMDNSYENGEPTGKGVLFSMMFHTFVFMQIFNEINCRRVGVREMNVFFNLFSNWVFVLVIAATFALQVLFDGYFMRLVGVVVIDSQKFFFCFLIGATVLLPAFLLKLLPKSLNKIFENILDEEKSNENDPVV